MAAFDVFQKPSGKKKFITRRHITRTSKPLLSEKHLPTLAPLRGKKCFSVSYLNIYKTSYEIKKIIEFKPLIKNVFLPAEKSKEIKFFDISKIQNHKRPLTPFLNSINIATKFCVKNANFTICSEKSKFISKIPDLKNKIYFGEVESDQGTHFKVLLYVSKHINKIYDITQTIKPGKGIISNQKPSLEKNLKQFNYDLPKKICVLFRDSAKESKLLKFNELKFNIFDYIYITETEDSFVYNSKVEETNVNLTESDFICDSLLFAAKSYKEVFFKYSDNVLQLNTRNNIHSFLSNTIGLIEHNFAQKNLKFSEKFSKNENAPKAIKREPTQPAILKSRVKQNFVILENKKEINSETQDAPFKYQIASNYKGSHLSYSYKDSLKAEYTLPNISGKLISSPFKFVTSIIKPSKLENLSYKNLIASTFPLLKSTVIYSKKDILNVIGFKTKKHKMFFKSSLHAKYTLKATKNITRGKDLRIKYKNKKTNIYIFIEDKKLIRTKTNYDFRFSMPHKHKLLLHENTLKMISLYSIKSFTKVCLGKNVKKVNQQPPSKYIYLNPQCHIRSYFSNLHKNIKTYSFSTTNLIFNKRIFLSRKKICNITNSVKKNVLVQNSYLSNLKPCLFVDDFKYIFNDFIKPIQHVFSKPAMLLIGLTKPMTVRHLCLYACSESIKNYIIPQEFKTVSKVYKCKTHLNPYPFGFPSFTLLPDKYRCISKQILMLLKICMVCKKPSSDSFILKNERIYRHPLSLKAPQKFIFSDIEKLIREPDYYRNRKLLPTLRLPILKLTAIKQSWEIAQFSTKLKIRILFKIKKRKFAERVFFANRFTLPKKAIYSDLITSESLLKRLQIKRFLVRANTKLTVFSRNDKFIISNEAKSKFSFFTGTVLTLPKHLSIVTKNFNFNVKSNLKFYFSQSCDNKLTQPTSNNYKSTFRSFRFPYKPESNSTKYYFESKIKFKTDKFLINKGEIINAPKMNKFYFKRLNLSKFITDGYRALDNEHTYLTPSKYNYVVNELTNLVSYIGPIDLLSIKNAQNIKIFPLFDSDNKFSKILLFSKMKYLKPNPEYIFAYYPHYPDLESKIKLNEYSNKNLNINKIKKTNLLLNKINNTIKLLILSNYLINESNECIIRNVFNGATPVMPKANFYESKITFSKLIQNRKVLKEAIDKKANIMLKEIQIKSKDSKIYNNNMIFKYTVLNSSEEKIMYSQKSDYKELKFYIPQTQILEPFRELDSNEFAENFNYKINIQLLKKDQVNNEIDISSAFEKNELREPGIPDWIDLQPFKRLKQMALSA
ncbi:MAG: hypothetical protein PHQ70_12425 [Arcobacter sp.]|nr:hypothetical protein [Arcobacter sp.]